MKRKHKSFPVKPALLLAAAAILLAGSTIGSTTAALTYYSENYTAQVNMSNIGVALVENGEIVSYRDYDEDGNWNELQNGKLLENMLGEGGRLVPGQKYTEELSVQNSGSIDTFVRVIVKKNWQDADGVADTSLNPDWIELNAAEDSGWVEAEDEATAERRVFYYTKAVGAGEETPALTDTIRIHPDIAKDVEKKVDGKNISYVYKYDGYSFTLQAEVNAVQTHNAADAIKSAWGVDVTVSEDETTLSLQ